MFLSLLSKWLYFVAMHHFKKPFTQMQVLFAAKQQILIKRHLTADK